MISSAIVDAPAPDIIADILRNKIHHFDEQTDEDMVPMFRHNVDGKPRKNQRLLPYRNWCCIRPYVPGLTPCSTTAQSADSLDSVRVAPTTAGEVNLDGGLEITLNVEISPEDPCGTTIPYSLIVPRLWYEWEG